MILLVHFPGLKSSWGVGKELCNFSDSVFVLVQNDGLVRSEHLYDTSKANSINEVGETPETLAVDNVYFQPSVYETGPKGCP